MARVQGDQHPLCIDLSGAAAHLGLEALEAVALVDLGEPLDPTLLVIQAPAAEGLGIGGAQDIVAGQCRHGGAGRIEGGNIVGQAADSPKDNPRSWQRQLV